jgi:hypothetical protein
MSSCPTPCDQWRFNWNAQALVAAIVALWGAFALAVMARDPVVGNLDMFGFIHRAESLSLHHAADWVDGYYPLGYPLLLRTVFCIVKDYELAGRIISFFSGVAGLFLICAIGSVTFDRRTGILALAFGATNPTYLRMATMSGTDSLAATLMLFGLLAVCFYSTYNRRKWLVASGLLLGAAYLVRYTALVMMPAVIAWLLVRPKNDSTLKEKLAEALIITSAFVVAAAPQLILSAMETGNPLYNHQASNVYISVLAHGDWRKWPEAAQVTRFSQILLLHPGAFARNWLSNIKDFVRLNVAQFPLNLFVLPAMLYCLKKGVNVRLTMLLLLAFFAYGFGLAAVFVSDRLLLPCAPIALIFVAYGFYEFVPDFPGRGLWLRHARQASFVLLIACMFAMYDQPLLSVSQQNLVRMQVSDLLNRSGAKSSREILCFTPRYYNLASPTKDNYGTNGPPNDFLTAQFAPYKSVDDIAGRMKSAGQRYLVFDSEAPWWVGSLTNIWPFDETAMQKQFVCLGSFKGGANVWRLKSFQ